MATPISFPNSWDLHPANPLLGHPQFWGPVSRFDEGVGSSTPIIKDYELDLDVTQSQGAQSHLHLPQIDWGSNQGPPLPYDNQATIPVSIIVYPQLT